MWTKRVFSRPHSDTVTTTIRLVDERVIVERSNLDKPFSFRWTDVDEIETFKLDLLTTDDIRLAFRVSDIWWCNILSVKAQWRAELN